MKNNSIFILIYLLFAPFSAIFAQLSNGDSVFNAPNMIHNIEFITNEAHWYDTLALYYSQSANTDSSKYLPVTVVVDGDTFPQVGIRFKGNSSYNNNSTKKSFKIGFDKFVAGQKLNGLETINLHNGFKDPTMLREKIALDFLRAHGMYAPRAQYTNLKINGQLYAFYLLVEEVDKTFLKTNFGNKSGNLFKGDPHGDLRWKGSATPSLYWAEYELKTNETANDFTDLIHLIDKINNTPQQQAFQDSLAKVLNVNNYLLSYAATMIFANLDSYCGSGHNYYVYHNMLTDKFEWINWDVNESFGNFTMPGAGNLATMSMFYYPTSRPLNQFIQQNITLKNQYKLAICQLLYDSQPAKIGFQVDSLANIIRPYVYADTRKFFPNNLFETNLTSTVQMGFTIPGLKDFNSQRYNALMTELGIFSCNGLAVSPSLSENAFSIYPNPANDRLFVSLEKGKKGVLSIYNLLGEKYLSQNITTETVCDISNLPKGMYFLKLEMDGKIGIKKWVKE